MIGSFHPPFVVYRTNKEEIRLYYNEKRAQGKTAKVKKYYNKESNCGWVSFASLTRDDDVTGMCFFRVLFTPITPQAAAFVVLVMRYYAYKLSYVYSCNTRVKVCL